MLQLDLSKFKYIAMEAFLKIITISSLVMIALFASSCATIFRGTDQVINITSEPSNANVLVDGSSMGKTPLSLSLRKSKHSSVMVKKAGYNTQTRQLNKSFDPISLLNIFWDYSTTDFISGAAFEYQPNSLHFNLETEETK